MPGPGAADEARREAALSGTTSVLQRLRGAEGNTTRLLAIVREAERSLCEDLHALADVYGTAVEVYGQAKGVQDFDFRDLCVKRLRALCRLSPTEAREFHNRMRTCGVGRADARMYEARAAMEERLGDTAKALKMLQEGVRVGAGPAHVLQKALQRLEAATAAREGAAAPHQQAPPPASWFAPTPRLLDAPPAGEPVAAAAAGSQPSSPPAPLPPAQLQRHGAQAVALGSGGAGAGCPAGAQPQVPAPFTPKRPEAPAAGDAAFASPAPPLPHAACPTPQHAHAAGATPTVGLRGLGARRPLGLGSPKRALDGEQAEETGGQVPAPDAAADARGAESDGPDREEEEEEEEKDEHGRQLDVTAASMSLMPLSPIREELDATPDRGSLHGNSSRKPRRSSQVPSAPHAPAPSAARGTQQPQQQQPDFSSDSSSGGFGEGGAAAFAAATPAAAPSPMPGGPQSCGSGRGGKVVHVNGVAYTQLELLGRGGSSKVYAVLSPTGDRLALKRVATENAKQLEAFENEVTLLQQLKHHEQIIQVIDSEVDYERGRISIVMEAGEADLNSYLRSEPRLGLAQIQRLWREMLQAVQVIHHERIVHADLKPGNFLLVGGQLKVIDFGIAKRLASDTTNISRDASVGTLSYMAPEAVQQGRDGLKLGRASDIWSLGIILYQMVYGRPPLAHMEPMQRWLKLSDPQLEIQLPGGHRLEGHSRRTKAQLADVLHSCLQRDPRKRPSLSQLLAHPFLCSSCEVRRDLLDAAIADLMAGVLNSLGAALPDQPAALPAGAGIWQALADEVWERVSGSAGGSSSSELAGALRATGCIPEHGGGSDSDDGEGGPGASPSAPFLDALSPLRSLLSTGAVADAAWEDAHLPADLPPPGSTAPLPPPGPAPPRAPLAELPGAGAAAPKAAATKRRAGSPRKPLPAAAHDANSEAGKENSHHQHQQQHHHAAPPAVRARGGAPPKENSHPQATTPAPAPVRPRVAGAARGR